MTEDDVQLENERDRMYNDMIACVQKWKAEGVHLTRIAARMLAMALIVAEGHGVPVEKVHEYVDRYHGRIKPERPKAKA